MITEIKKMVLEESAIDLAEECVACSEYIEWFENGEFRDGAAEDYVDMYYAAVNDYEERDEEEFNYMLNIFVAELLKRLA